jgi:tetratricopeptide (TPR) repeat protein
VTDDQSQRTPYPGLRAFRREETDLFFGREDCINAMVDRLAATRFLAVLGSSGTGKSSLVRTGLLDALELGLMAKAGSRWTIVDFKPGGSPLKNLAHRLLEAQNPDPHANIAQQDIDLLRAYLARGPRAIVEWCRAGHLPAGGNLLLLVDQFEELFRYQDYEGREEAEAFVALLLESAHEAGVPIYVTITMRSEYLGACSLIEGLADAINAGMFLTPRMTREHCREAIVGPASVCNIDIEPALVNRLLNDLANFAPWDEHDSTDQLNRLMRRADQLPLLQYTLNRMWQRARERSGNQRVQLTVRDYEAIEGLSGALNAHANQIFETLGKSHAQTAEWIFRALTAGSSIADAVRRPTRLADLIAACGGDETAVREVVDAFRAPGVNFLVPEYDPNHPKLTPDTYIDISHESLIRQWKKLSEWLEAEGRAAQQWRRLVDRYSVGEMLRGRELANFIAWRTETNPNESWAKRYGGDYPAVIGYLSNSQRAQNSKRIAMIASVVGAFVLITGFAIYAILQRNDAIRQTEMVAKQNQKMAEQNEQIERNQAFFTSTFEKVLLSLEAPLGSAGAGSSLASAARRVQGSGPKGNGRDQDRPADDQAADQVDDSVPASGDRTTTETGTRRGLALTTAMTLEQAARELHKENFNDPGFRRLFVVALNQLGDVKLEANDEDGAERAFNEALEVSAALMQINARDEIWRADRALSLAGIARVKARRNDHGGAQDNFQQAIKIERELIRERPEEEVFLKNLQEHLKNLGDIQVRLGARADALLIFEERLAVSRQRLRVQSSRLARAPRNLQLRSEVHQLQSGVSVALDRIGQLIRDAGDPNRARSYFEEALKIDRDLFKIDPNRRTWQDNLVFSLARIGDLDRQLGRQREALEPIEEALALQRKIVADSNAPEPLRGLASLLQKAGDINRRLKQFPAAISAHGEEVGLRRRLLASQETDLVGRRDLSAALDYLGNTLRESGALDKARAAFAEQLQIDRAILREYRTEIRSHEDVAWSLNRMGDLERQDNHLSDAARYYEEAVGIQRGLIAAAADNPVRMRALAAVVSKLAQVRSSLSEHTAALTLHREELALRQRLYQRAPDDNDALRDVSLANDRVGNVLRDLNQFQEALKFFEAELALDRSFAARAPTNITALSDVQWTLNKISEFVLQRLDDRPAARRYIEEMIGIDRRLVELQPTKERHHRLRDDLAKLAGLLLDLAEPAQARATYGEVFLTDQRWVAIARENYMKDSTQANRNDLTQAYGDAGWHGILAGRVKEALPLIEAALSINPDTPWNTVNLGHAHLFLGDYRQAVKYYRSVKDRSRNPDGKRHYSDEILDDFALLRRLGLMLPEMAQVERELSL